MNRLQGKVALVTGGARGIGAATVEALVGEGAKVLIADVLDGEGSRLVDRLGANTDYVRLDVTDAEQWTAAVERAVAVFGKLDVLVNNAGVARFGPVQDHARADWDAVLAVNLTGPFLGIQAAAPAMKAAGGGSIINVSSIAGLMGVRGVAAYVASKWGVRGLTKAAALDLADDGIRVNSIHPGFVMTPMIAAHPPGVAHVAQHRHGDPAEIAALIIFLASDESSFSTGAEFVADGGETAGNAAAHGA